LAAALRWAGVRLRCAVERRLDARVAVELERRLPFELERVPVELERRVPVELERALLRRVLLVLLRLPVPRLFWVAIWANPSSASVKLLRGSRFS
jgi:hypothetical protein